MNWQRSSARTAAWIAVALTTLSLATTGVAQSAISLLAKEDAADRDLYPPIELTIAAADEPEPALRYHLLPPGSERTPGNAAPYYYRALLLNAQQSREHRTTYAENYERWEQTPLDEPTRQEIRQWLAASSRTLAELETATRREFCDWDLRLQDLQGVEVISFVLPDAQETRDLARILSLKAHLEIQERRFGDALHTLRMGYRMGSDVGREATLIHGLVGIAECGVMNAQVRQLMGSPGSPNLYWALAQLPHPLVDTRPQIRYESQMAFRMFALLRDAETAQRTPEQWRHLLHQFFEELEAIDGGMGADKLMTTAVIARGYPTAKQGLIDMGFNPGEVEQMPVGQVIAIYSARTYQRIADEEAKWTELPFWMAHGKMRASQSVLSREGFQGTSLARREVLPIATLLLPAMQAASVAKARLAREIAALQTVEAIRLHLARNEDRLPDSLDELEFPAPYDPYFNRPFDYQVSNSKAIIKLDVPEGIPPMPHRQIELTVSP